MKMDVVFSENNTYIPVKLSENNQTFNTGFGEVMVVHDGRNGATFTPAVSDDGVISWTNDRGLPNPAPINIKGRKGDKGEQGEKGDTGAKGEKGDTGATGAQGPQGPAGPRGAQGEKGDTGPAGANGKDGAPGKDGKTPVAGTDYFTESDKAEMVSAVLASLPVYQGEVVAV